MIVQFRNEKVSNHGSIPITIDCNVVAFIVFEEGFHQPIKRTKHHQIWKWELELVARCGIGSGNGNWNLSPDAGRIWKWEIVNPDDPDQDSGTKLLYCHRSWTSEQNFELI
ncbi:hypothetical protein TNCV_1284471 [Trichonephila clavipes]|uniref:Uncharacterized protein n=1 Tax=Trichonephila clavipes TaxID=2585209 RepID=A0A8X6VER6_TRICX|nr:hypothetical protein TNCV_1284471 [Trichonephila clavipes]